MAKTANASYAGSYATLPDVFAFLHFLQRRIAEMSRSGEHLAVIYLQIGLSGDFRRIPVEALDRASYLIRGSLRDMDLIARGQLGEFFLMLPRCTAAMARIVANRMEVELKSTKVEVDGADELLNCQIDVQAAAIGEEAGDLLSRMVRISCSVPDGPAE